MAALLLLCLFHAVLPRKYIYKEHSLRLNAVSHQMSFVGWQDVCLLQARLGRRGLSPEKQGRTKLWVHRSGVLGEKNQIEYHVKFYASPLKYIWANGPCVVQYSPPPFVLNSLTSRFPHRERYDAKKAGLEISARWSFQLITKLLYHSHYNKILHSRKTH